MSKSVANVVIATDSFATLVTRVNQLSDAMTNEVLTANSGASGSTTTGNAAVVGIFSANTIAVPTALRGGSVSTSGNLNVTSNLVITGTTTTVNSSFIANNTTFGVYSNTATLGGNTINITATNTNVSSTLTITGEAHFANTMEVHSANAYINALSTVITGSEVSITSNNFTISANQTTFQAAMEIDGPLVVANTITIGSDILFGDAGILGRQTFTANADIGSSTSSPILVWTYPKTEFTLANLYTIAKTQSGANVQATQASIITNGTDAHMTVFAILAAPNTANLGVFSVTADTANVNLYYTQTSPDTSITLNITLNS